MTDHTQRGDYLSGESDGRELSADERGRLDRVRTQLSNEALWDEPAPDGQFRLLAAAAAEAAESTGPEATLLDPTRLAVGGPEVVAPTDIGAARSAPPERGLRSTTDDVAVPIDLDERRRRSSRTKWFGAGVLTAAAVAAIAAIGVTQLTSTTEADDDALEVAATFELTATELDSDTVAELDVMPTVAGVQLELRLMGLDNATGGEYYSAWLLPTATTDPANAEAIPLGSFHWRTGGVPIILWSGVDDPAFSRFIVTRQTQGDLGLRSDQVVLAGEIPTLTADG